MLSELSYRLIWPGDCGQLSIGVQILTNQEILGTKSLQSNYKICIYSAIYASEGHAMTSTIINGTRSQSSTLKFSICYAFFVQ